MIGFLFFCEEIMMTIFEMVDEAIKVMWCWQVFEANYDFAFSRGAHRFYTGC
jgi:hypothetical protein